MSTHDLQVTETTVIKTFRSWERGEPDREWDSLALLQHWAPGLAPDPIERREDDGHPVIVMSKMPGEPLGDRPMLQTQLVAVIAAFSRLHRSVPASALEELPARVFAPAVAVDELRERMAQPPRFVADADTVARAFAAGAVWLESDEAARFAAAQPHPVFGHADGNLANYLWDGAVCRLVDFENAGASDVGYEIAELLEHPSTWLDEGLPAESLLAQLGFDLGLGLGLDFGLDPALMSRIRVGRRLLACNWLTKLMPDEPAHGRDPLTSIHQQAERLLSLL